MKINGEKLKDVARIKRFYQLPEIKGAGKMILDPVWALKTHKSGAIELMHVIRGNVAVVLGKARIEAGAGGTLLIPKGVRHRDEFDLSVGLEAFYVFFDWPPGEDYFRSVKPPDAARICGAMSVEIGKLCDRMHVGLTSGTETDRLLISSYTHNILILILREMIRKDQGPTDTERRRHGESLIAKAREYIDVYYAEPVSLEQIAGALRISSFYLSHLFSQESNFSFVEYLTSVRMRKAKELLMSGRENVSETAYAVGYNDSNYFSKVFHRYFGVSPQSARCGQSGRSRA